MAPTVKSRALQKAAEVVGGEEELAARLGLNVKTVRLLMSGKLALPQRIFLQAIDIISSADLPVQPEAPVDERGERADQ